jgi:hypothetical protein
MTTIGKLHLVRAIVALVLLLQPTGMLRPAAGAMVITSNNDVPFSDLVVPGCEEPVILSGRFHFLTHVTIDDSDGFHMESHLNAQNVSGVGATTGTTYWAPLAEVSAYETSGPPPLEVTGEASYALIGQGPASDLVAHSLFHLTINANGEVTAFVTDTRVDCTEMSDPVDDN